MDSRSGKSEYHFREYHADSVIHFEISDILTQERLDITAEVCPMTFVRVKLKLQALAPGATLLVRLREGEPLANVPRSRRQEGHEIVALNEEGAGVHLLEVRKKRA